MFTCLFIVAYARAQHRYLVSVYGLPTVVYPSVSLSGDGLALTLLPSPSGYLFPAASEPDEEVSVAWWALELLLCVCVCVRMLVLPFLLFDDVDVSASAEPVPSV